MFNGSSLRGIRTLTGPSGNGGGSSFGAHMTVPLNGVTSMDLLLSQISAGNTKWVISLLNSGILVPSLEIDPAQVFFPQGSAAKPSIAFMGDAIANKTGLFYSQALSAMIFSVNGAQQMILAAGDQISLQGDAVQFIMGSISQGRFGLVDTFNVHLSSTAGDTQIGLDGALAVGTSIGFLDEPTMPGIPTARPTRKEIGHNCSIWDSTNHVRWQFDGTLAAGRWYPSKRRGMGTAIASASVLASTITDRALFDYFHVTGTTNIDFIRFDAAVADLYAPIANGEEIELYFQGALTLNNNTASPGAGTYPLQLVGGVNAAVAANSKIRFRRDDTQAKWVELSRSAA